MWSDTQRTLNRRPLVRRIGPAVALLALMGAVAGCSSPHTGNVYERGELGRVMALERGTVVSVRTVQVEGTESGIGAGSGALAGGIAGSQIGGEHWIGAIGAVGGALVGGLAGAAAEQGVTADTAQEIIVELADGTTAVVVQKAGEYALAPGQPVVLVRGDRMRVVPAERYGTLPR